LKRKIWKCECEEIIHLLSVKTFFVAGFSNNVHLRLPLSVQSSVFMAARIKATDKKAIGKSGKPGFTIYISHLCPKP
jgi:hypothetical protein